jgi:hypothetical protein
VHRNGSIFLRDAMALTAGDLVLDGLTFSDCPQEGGGTPPVLSGASDATVSAGNLVLTGCASLGFSSSQSLLISGDFVNESTCPGDFNFNGNMNMGGASSLGAPPPQTFEVAGRDLGPGVAGFATNFSMGGLEIAPGANVLFQDQFDNFQDGQTPCGEALYVGHLTLRAGSTITLDNCRVYFNQLLDEGGAVNLIGCAGVVPTGDSNGDGAINLIDFAGLLSCFQNEPGATGCSSFDYDADSDVDLNDLAVFENSFTG